MFHIPMSSPMITRMLGGFGGVWAMAGASIVQPNARARNVFRTEIIMVLLSCFTSRHLGLEHSTLMRKRPVRYGKTDVDHDVLKNRVCRLSLEGIPQFRSSHAGVMISRFGRE